ncbi:MAG: 4-(cytidine 5'-diphospho)-2-C-methyl-D-erythritol kinase [Chitinophagaceae bacterium]
MVLFPGACSLKLEPLTHMLNFPNCKINLGLHITRRRDDGFHDLETVFYPIYKLHDVLEIMQIGATTRQHNQASDPIAFTVSGLRVEGPSESNLCLKAYQLLRADFPHLPAIQMHLHKTIPMGAGLGGGSADGAFALNLLNEKFHLGLTRRQLIEYALRLGSDCPFFIVNNPCFAWSRGEMLEELGLDLSGYAIVIINPGVHVNTGWAFRQIIPHQPAIELKELILEPIYTWRDRLVNDFEQAVTHAHPVIGSIKNAMYQSGAVYAAMSGSGSTVYGIFETDKMPAVKLFPGFLELHFGLGAG